MNICKENGCKSTILAREYCRKHYLRWYRHGDPSIVLNPSDYIPTGIASPNFKHGLWKHPIYKVWNHMLNRCNTPSDKSYKNYGARGIKVCPRWNDLSNFIEDMGPRPINFSIERKNNNGDYEPSNCIWADSTTQSRNRRYTKLSFEKAQQIRNGKKNGDSRRSLADRFLVSESTIKKVLSCEYWKSAPSITSAISESKK